jgi:hypothetical protein
MTAIRAGQALKTQMIYHARSGRAFSHEMRVEPLKDSRGLVQCFQVTSSPQPKPKPKPKPKPQSQPQPQTQTQTEPQPEREPSPQPKPFPKPVC